MLARPALSTKDSLPAAAIAPEQHEVIHRHLPAALVSGLVHVVVLLVLPLFDLPRLKHAPVPVTVSQDFSYSESASAFTAETPVVLSMTLPDSPLAALAEQFAAKPANPAPAGGATIVEPVERGDLTATIGSFTALTPSRGTAEGAGKFDPAGTRDVLPTRTDLSLLVPDPEILAVPALSAEEMEIPGGPESEAIAAALRWIVRRQHPEGRWRRRRLYVNQQVLQAHSDDIHMTSLALLPLIALRQTHERGKYREQVSAAVMFLSAPDSDPVYREAEAVRALALCELFIATRDARVRAAAQSSIKRVIAENYRPSNDPYAYPDYKTTWAWQVFALRAASDAGLQDNTNILPTIKLCASHTAVMSQYGDYRLGWRQRPLSPPVEAENIFAAVAYSSADQHDSLIRDGATKLAAQGAAFRGERTREADYFTTLLLKKLDHAAAPQWNVQTTQHLLDTQIKFGRDLGSWEATHSSEETFQATVFSTLILSVPSETLLHH